MGPRDSSEDPQKNGKNVSAMLKLNLNLQMNESTDEPCDYTDIDEPVSPPACNPEEGPPLLFSQTIEEIASEVVDENRSVKSKPIETDNDNIPKTVELGRRSSVGSLIPVTVSEISENPPTYPYKSPSALHMSGGMVSTDVTLHMASVPTSVITANTSFENKLEQDEGIDKILQYFIHTDEQYKTEKAMDNILQTKPCNPSVSPNPSTMFHILPLDLSITKLPNISQSSPLMAEENLKTEGKIQKEVTRDVSQKSRGVKRSVVIENEGKTQTKKFKKDTESSIEIIPINGQKDFKIDSQIENIKETNDVDCKLILPRRKEEKARLVFSNGMFVEIERDLFNNFEHNIVDKKTKCQTNSKKTDKSAKNVTGDFRRKKAISRRQSEKKISIDVQKPMHIQDVLDPQPNIESIEDKWDKKPKDMPLIVSNDNETIQAYSIDPVPDKTEQLIKHKQTSAPTFPTITTSTRLPVTILSSNTLFPTSNPTPPTPPHSTPPSPTSTCITPPPPTSPTVTPPSSPPSPSGLHKLPSIVSKPSYYAKSDSTKVLKTK